MRSQVPGPGGYQLLTYFILQPRDDFLGELGIRVLCLFELFSNFWLLLANFERPVLGCIEAKFCK